MKRRKREEEKKDAKKKRNSLGLKLIDKIRSARSPPCGRSCRARMRCVASGFLSAGVISVFLVLR